jgi:hypothetical protein
MENGTKGSCVITKNALNCVQFLGVTTAAKVMDSRPVRRNAGKMRRFAGKMRRFAETGMERKSTIKMLDSILGGVV